MKLQLQQILQQGSTYGQNWPLQRTHHLPHRERTFSRFFSFLQLQSLCWYCPHHQHHQYLLQIKAARWLLMRLQANLHQFLLVFLVAMVSEENQQLVSTRCLSASITKEHFCFAIILAVMLTSGCTKCRNCRLYVRVSTPTLSRWLRVRQCSLIGSYNAFAVDCPG